jgi:hypothetical protein
MHILTPDEVLGYMITEFLCAGGSRTVAKTGILYGTTCFVREAPAHRNFGADGWGEVASKSLLSLSSTTTTRINRRFIVVVAFD